MEFCPETSHNQSNLKEMGTIDRCRIKFVDETLEFRGIYTVLKREISMTFLYFWFFFNIKNAEYFVVFERTVEWKVISEQLIFEINKMPC